MRSPAASAANRWITWGAVVVVLAALGLAVAFGAPDRADAASGAAPEGRAAAIAWRTCGARLQCARVRVPLNWSARGAFTGSTGRAAFAGPTITLALIRYRASRPQSRIGSLFMNFGGPGVSGTATIRAEGAQWDRIARGRFDIIGWDPRGTGESTHVRCFADAAAGQRFWGPDWAIPTTPAQSRAYVPKTIAFERLCRWRSGRFLKYIATADTVRDLDYLRQLVGDRRLNYFGQSYGTFIGQTYANMFPSRVGRMVMDGFIDPVPYVRSVQAAILAEEQDSDLVFAKFQSLCQRAGPARCALAGDGPVAPRVRALLARLRQGPIPAPTGPPPHQLSYGDTLLALWLSLGTPASWPTLAQGLDQAADGDGSAIDNTVAPQKPGLEEALIPATELQCADKRLPPPGAVQRWPSVIGALSRNNLVAPVDGWLLWAPCASWQSASANRYTGPWNVTTPNPILLLANRYDPRTAYPNARTAARRLGNSVLVTNNGYGHTTPADVSTCINTTVGRYLTTLRTPPRGTVCQPDHTPFDADFGKGKAAADPSPAIGHAAGSRARPSAGSSPRAAGVLPGQAFTALGASVISSPRPVLATDGRYHLAYELLLTSATTSPVDVQRVEVRDARTKRVLHSLSGRALSSRMNAVGSPPGDAATNTRITPSGTSIVWMDVRVRRRADLPRVIEHRVVATTRTTAGEVVSFTSLIGREPVSTATPVQFGPPVGSGRWVADEGCCDDDTHHRRGFFFVDGTPAVFQRFAIDWMKLDSRNRVWAGDPRNLSNYVSYGEPLIAVADGTVVITHDGEPNTPPPNNPPPPSPLARLTGNHVTLRVAPGVYVLYAHMVPGSVRVRVGQRVRRGQMLGRLGNSGNSATPHMHLQVQVNRSFVSDGLPFVFDRFQFLGQITTPFTDENVGLRTNPVLRFVPGPNAGTRHRQMPLDRNVVRFPVTSLTGRTR